MKDGAIKYFLRGNVNRCINFKEQTNSNVQASVQNSKNVDKNNGHDRYATKIMYVNHKVIMLQY